MTRYYSFDLLKCIAIILVVFYHASNTNIIVHDILFPLYSIGVPLFFIVNGALLFNKDFATDKHYRKILKIIILTIVWTFIILSLISIFGEKDFTLAEIVKIGWFGDTKYVINQYWFLKALIILYLFFPLFKRTFDVDKFNIIIFFSICTVFTIGLTSIYLLHQLFNYILNKPLISEIKNYIPWYNFFENYSYSFSFAYFLSRGIILFYKDKMRRNIYLYIYCFILSWIIAVLYSYFLRQHMIQWDACFNGYSTPMTFIMTISIFIISIIKPINKLPLLIELISKNTLGIYLIHGIIIYFTRQFFIEANIILYFIYATFILLTSLFIILFCKQLPYIRKLFII